MIYMKKQARQQMIKTDLLFFVVLRSLSNVYYIEVLEVSFDFLDFRKTPGQIFTLGAKTTFEHKIASKTQCTVFENHRKSLILQLCERSEDKSWQKMSKNNQSNETFRVIFKQYDSV